jgi:hypothetical protein
MQYKLNNHTLLEMHNECLANTRTTNATTATTTTTHQHDNFSSNTQGRVTYNKL